MNKHIVIDARIRRSSTGRYVDRLLDHLQNSDTENRYTILLTPDDPWQPRAGNFSSLPCPFPQFSLNPLHQFGFARQLRSLHPDLVHFTMTQQPLLYFGNIVTTTHDTTMYHYVRRGTMSLPIYWVKLALYKFLVWWSHRKSKKIITPTETVAKEFAERQPFTKDKLVVTYEASEPPMGTPAIKPGAIGEDDRFIMYLGTAFPHKNLDTLVTAFDLINAKHPELKLVLVGKRDKHYIELEENIKKHPSANNILTTGFLPDEEVKWMYQHTKAYVFASLSEGFGLPPLEAMAHGAPVVSSKASVMPEVYGNAAHYFDPRDPEDIASKTDDVLTDLNLRSQLIQNGYTQLKKYSWAKMAKETLAIYKEVLKS